MFLVTLTFLLIFHTVHAKSDHFPPNIVFILVDDVGWADFNYTSGGKGSIPTPNIDRLSGIYIYPYHVSILFYSIVYYQEKVSV